MSYQEIDLIFPFVVFAYGIIMTFTLHNKFLMDLAHKKLPTQVQSLFTQHRVMGLVCFYVGGLWTLQNVWYMNL